MPGVSLHNQSRLHMVWNINLEGDSWKYKEICFISVKNEETLNIDKSFESVLNVVINLQMHKIKYVMLSTNEWWLCHTAMRNVKSLAIDHHGRTQDRPGRLHTQSALDYALINNLVYIFHPPLIPI